MDDDDLIHILEKTLINQKMLIVESGSEKVDPCILPILQKKYISSKGKLN